MNRKYFLTLAMMVEVIAVALFSSGPASAQLQTGSIHGTVLTEDGSALPGVTATLTGVGAPQVQVSDEQGKFRFLGLSPGIYTVKAELQGYVTMERTDLDVSVGRNTDVSLTLGFGDTINVVGGEAPLLDTHRFARETSISRVEMDSVPSSRDPWGLLSTVPGVQTDRINVGGNESGQQSNFVGPGSLCTQAVWSLDGMVITDMSAVGASPGYFDFESFEEMQITTGGSDASVATGGVVLNMVTRRGTDQWRGSARYLAGDDGSQSDLDLDSGELGQAGPWNRNTAQAEIKQGNRIVEVSDYGAEVGGPIVKEKLWIWGSYAEQKIDLLTVNDFSDESTIKDWNLKLNGQVTPTNSATAFFWQSDKIKLGRNAGPLRPQETTWNQAKFGPDPTAWKVEDTQIFGSSFYLTGMFSVVNGGFELAPQGGDKVPFLDANGVWNNSFLLVQVERPQQQAKLDASSYFGTGNVSHELKYGAGYRVAEQTTLNRWPGGGIDVGGLLLLSRDGKANVEADYGNVFVQDTVSRGNLTANIGLRWDRQGGELLDTNVAANPVFPELLPATTFQGRDSGFEWSTLSPRLGLTYALGEQRKTLLRASYSRFADQLATGFAGWLHPLGAPQYRYFLTTNDGGPTLDPGELGDEIAPPSGNVNPFTLAPLISNAVDPNLNAPITDELLLGIEHAIRSRAGGRPELQLPADERPPRNRAARVRRRSLLPGKPGTDRPPAPARRLRAQHPGRRAAQRGALLAFVLDPAQRRQHPQRVPAAERRPRAGVPGRVALHPEAAREPLDGARQRLLAGLDLGHPRLRERGSHRHDRRRNRERYRRAPGLGHRLGRQGERVHQQQLVLQPDRPLPGRAGRALGVQPRREPDRPAGLPDPLCPPDQPRADRGYPRSRHRRSDRFQRE
jgi:hypothetical protein